MVMLPICPLHTSGTCPHQETPQQEQQQLNQGVEGCYELETDRTQTNIYTHSHIHTVHTCYPLLGEKNSFVYLDTQE